MRHEQRSIAQLTTDFVMKAQPAPVAMTVTATITTAAILGGLITGNQGGAAGATYTLPTGTVMDAALTALLGTPMPLNYAFEFTIVNISTVGAEDITVQGDTGMTAVGNMTIASNAAVGDQAWGTFRVRKTATNTFSFYRVG